MSTLHDDRVESLDTRMLESLAGRKLRSPIEALAPVLWHLVLLLASFGPRKFGFTAARGLGWLKYRLRGRRIRMRPELERMAEPDELERWKRRLCELFAYEDLDYRVYARGRDPRTLITVRGLERLEDAVAEGDGAVLYSMHIVGVWTFLAALGAHGYSTTVIRYEPEHALVPMNRRLSHRRIQVLEERFLSEFHYMDPSNFGIAVKAAHALRRNRVVVVLIDKVWSKHTADVDFLGGSTTFVCGHALLAHATGAPLLDFFVHRDGRSGPQVAEIGPPLPLEESIEATCRSSASRLEAHVRKHPEHWYWYT